MDGRHPGLKKKHIKKGIDDFILTPSPKMHDCIFCSLCPPSKPPTGDPPELGLLGAVSGGGEERPPEGSEANKWCRDGDLQASLVNDPRQGGMWHGQNGAPPPKQHGPAKKKTRHKKAHKKLTKNTENNAKPKLQVKSFLSFCRK